VVKGRGRREEVGEQREETKNWQRKNYAKNKIKYKENIDFFQ
jgi:hypothetical protein